MGTVLQIKEHDSEATLAERWIEAFCMHGDGTRAVYDAGYDVKSKASAASVSYMNKQRYKSEIIAKAREAVAIHAPAAVNTLVQLAAESDQDSVRATACKALASMAGLDVPEEQKEAQDKRTDAELIAAIGELIKDNDNIKQALIEYIK